MAGMFRRDRLLPMRRWLRWSALLLLLPCALASAGFGSKSRQLDEMMAAYTAALRWGSFEDGWQFIEPEVRKAHPLTELDERLVQLIDLFIELRWAHPRLVQLELVLEDGEVPA